MVTIASCALIGYLTAFLGIAGGILLSRAVQRTTPLALLTGGSAGLLTAFICFDMLPVSFARWGLYRSMACVAVGLIFAAGMDAVQRFGSSSAKHMPLTQAAAVALHHIPEGAALGAALAASPSSGLFMAAALALHCLPESLIVFAPLSAETMPFSRRLKAGALLSLPMMLGCVPGFIFGGFSTAFMDGSLCFASGMMLYAACGVTVPDGGGKRKHLQIWGALAGFAAGISIAAM